MGGSKGKHMCFIHSKEVSKELSSAQPKPGVFSCPEWHLQVPPAADKGLLVSQRLTGAFLQGDIFPEWGYCT